MIGSICNDYADLENYKEIGKGGFGKVYLYASPSDLQLAIKKEKQVCCTYYVITREYIYACMMLLIYSILSLMVMLNCSSKYWN